MTTPVHEHSPRSRRDRMVAPLLTALVGSTAVTALAVRDPHAEGSWGVCPFLLLTGQPCPGCGGLRAVNDLTRLDVVGALSSNAFVVLMMGAVAVAWVGWVVRRWRGDDGPLMRIGRTGGTVLVVSFVVFAVFRLTPWGSWLAP